MHSRLVNIDAASGPVVSSPHSGKRGSVSTRTKVQKGVESRGSDSNRIELVGIFARALAMRDGNYQDQN